MRHLLCVDDEPRVLSGLQRQLRGMHDDWHLASAGDGQRALELLHDGEFDAIVTDLCMPGMDGAELLTHAVDTSPRTLRVVLSGHADPERHLAARVRAHRCLEKPCPADELERTLSQGFAVRDEVERPGHAALARLWCTSPERVESVQALLPVLHGPSRPRTAQALLDGVLASDPRLEMRLAALLHAALPDDAAARAALGSVREPEPLLPVVVCLRLLETVFAADRSWEEGLAGARCAGRLAAGCGAPPAERAAAAAIGLLLPPAAPAEVAHALSWLLRSWGVPETALAGRARAARARTA